MKTYFTIFLVIAATSSQINAQNYEGQVETKNELKLNAFFLPGGYLELTYERSAGKDFAYGLSIGSSFNDGTSNYTHDFLTYKAAAMPYARYYFGRKPQAGFFLEINSALYWTDSFDESNTDQEFGLGMALGAKFRLKRNWSVELYGGGGLNTKEFGSNETSQFLNFPDTYARIGVTIGKRF